MEHKRAPTCTQSRILYVVLQGEFALFREVQQGSDHDTLWIMAPNVTEDPKHVYKAGPWLTTDWETAPELPRRLLPRHVHGEPNQNERHCGRATPENNPDIFIKLGRETLAPGEARVVIKTPMPLAILPGRIESTPTVVITVSNQDGTRSYPPVTPNPTVIPILVYKWYDGRRPDLWDQDTESTFVSSDGPSDQLQSLQIYASSLVDENKSHGQAAFTKAARLLGVNATIDWIDDESLFKPDYAIPPPGLSWAQVNLVLSDVVHLTAEQRGSDLPVQPPLKVVKAGNCGAITG